MWVTLLADEDASTPLFGVDVTGARHRAVVELLVVEANRPVSVERIIDELWPDQVPKTARNSIQRFVADIRKALGADRERLQTTADGYLLRLDSGEADIHVVERLRHEADRAHEDPDAAAALLREALSFFGTLNRVPYTEAGNEALRSHEELRLQLLEDCITHEITTKASPHLIDELNDLTRQHPYRERFWSQLMTVLNQSGRRVEALRAYDQARRRLIDDVGVEPSAELRSLHADLLSEPEPMPEAGHDADSGAASVASPDARPAPTPRSLAGLIGREGDYTRVRELLADHRLVTIAGPGGVGKTTLARAIAQSVSTETDDQAVIVRLAEVRAGSAIADLVATAMAIETEGSSSEAVATAIVDVLATTPRLIVLDNAEHVVAATAVFVDEILDRTEATVLVTSRERLGLRDEWTHPLRGLETPDAHSSTQSESEQLFAQRASALGVDVTAQAAEVATICTALDGLPLAIEIVAGQLGHLGIYDIVARLDTLLDIRATHASSERHASLSALLQWSWDLLTPGEANVVEQLSVFAGRIDASTFLTIVGGDHESIAAVVAKNLITSTVEDGRAFYSLPVSVRSFATSKAREAATLAEHRNRHADFVLDHLRQWKIVELNAWHDAIDAAARHELEYVLALEWLDESDRGLDVLELAIRVTGLWGRRGPRGDLLRWSQRCGEIAAELADSDERILDRETEVGVLVMRLEAAFRFADYEAMTLYGNELVRSESIQATDIGTPLLGFYGAAVHTFDLAPTSLANVHAACERAPNTATADLNVAQTLMWLGSTQLMNRDYEAAVDSFQRVIDITTRPGGTVLWAELGGIAALMLLGRQPEAEAACARITSGSDESVWNYATDVVQAIAMAAGGDTQGAREFLYPAARNRILERRASSRNDFQIGFGLIASYAGEDELATALLRDPIPQSPVIATLLISHLVPDAPSADEWRSHWVREMSSRLLSSNLLFGDDPASVEEDLARWWPDYCEPPA